MILRSEMMQVLSENFGKKLFVLLLCLLTGKAVLSQGYQFKPKYDWSIGIEHSSFPVLVLQQAYLPDNIEISQWIRKHRYWQVGIIYVPLVTETTQTDSLLNIQGDTISKPVLFQTRLAFYGGFALKYSLSRKIYFTPALNFYLEDYYYDSDNWLISVGPTAAFEYFPSQHFSIRADLFNFNFAVGSYGNFFVTIHRLAGIGLRYNFNGR